MNEPRLPDPKQAMDTIFQKVYRDTVLHTLAGRGYGPRTQKEAEDVFRTIQQLNAAEASPAFKQAADNNPFGVAADALGGLLQQNGVQGPPTSRALAVKQAAADLAQDPDLYGSVLSVKFAEAAAMAAQHGQVA